MLCDDLEGLAGIEGWEGADICTHVADSLHCTAETNASS